MTELTISANEITEALRKHVTEFNPAVGAEQSVGSSRSATVSRASPVCLRPRSTSSSSSKTARSDSR